MQVEQLPAIAARGAETFRAPYGNGYPAFVGRSNGGKSSRAPGNFTRHSPALPRNSRARSNSRISSEEEPARGNLPAAVGSSNRGHYINNRSPRYSNGGCSRSSDASGATQSKSSHHQQNWKRPYAYGYLPPRFRTEQSNKKSSHQTNSGRKNNSSQTKSTSTASSVQKSAESHNTASSVTPAVSSSQTHTEQPEVIAATPSNANDDSVVAMELATTQAEDSTDPSSASTSTTAIHLKMSSSADSGHCEDLTSSCESTVFDPLSDYQNQEVGLVSMVINAAAEPVNTSDLHGDLDDDDVFLDALSSLSSESSSVYMTPCYSRSRSPEPELADHTHSSLSCSVKQEPSLPMESLIMQKLLVLSQQDSSSSTSTIEDVSAPLESCDSQVTILADSGNMIEKLQSLSISFTHASSVFDISEEECSSGSSDLTLLPDLRTRQKSRSTDLTNVFVGEVELAMSSDEEDSAIDFEVKSSSPSLHEEEDGDSGCATSIGSPDKTAPPSLDFTRPGIFRLVGGIPQEASRERVSPDGIEHGCDIAELLPSPLEEREKEEEEEGKDEWPDLFAEEIQPPQQHHQHQQCELEPPTGSSTFNYPPVPLHPVTCPPTNGYVHPLPSPPLPPFSSSSAGKPDSDPSVLMATITSHIRQQQQAVYQHHANYNAMMYSNGFPMGPPPPPPPHPPMFGGPPTGFPGYYPPPPGPLPPGPLPPSGPPPPGPPPPGHPPHVGPMPPPSFPTVPCYPPPLPPHPPNGATAVFPSPPLPLHHMLPLSVSPSVSSCEDTQASSVCQSTPSPSPCPSPVICEKHRLCTTWVMWYDRITGSGRGQMKDYKDTLNNVSTIDSIEDFWYTYNNIQPPSGLATCANYHFFKEGILPLWEDSANKQGGKWVLTIKDNPRNLDQVWMEVLLMMIGGGMDQFDDVNGVVVSKRKKGDRIALWTKKRSKKASQNVCVELVRALCLAFEVEGEAAKTFVQELADNQHGISLSFSYHSDSLKSGNSYSNEQHFQLKDLVDTILEVL